MSSQPQVNDIEIRKLLGAVRLAIRIRGYDIKKANKAKKYNSWYLVCHRESDGRTVSVRVSDHESKNSKVVNVSISPKGDDYEQLIRWLK